MREEITWLQETHGRRINQGVLEELEEKNIIFVEDGVNIQQVINEGETGLADANKDIVKWKRFPKKAIMNINKYIAKYDFEIANKLRGKRVEVVTPKDKQKVFYRFAMLELLHDISSVLNGGNVFYNTLTTMEGNRLPVDITQIPEDARILIVSYQAPEAPTFKGIKGNIYDVKVEKDAEAIRNLKNRHGIQNVMDSWFNDQLKKWNMKTPSIQTFNKIDELKRQYGEESSMGRSFIKENLSANLSVQRKALNTSKAGRTTSKQREIQPFNPNETPLFDHQDS